MTIIEKAKKEFYSLLEKHPEDPWDLKNHIPEAEKWADWICKRYPEADREVLMLAVWLHDIGHYPVIEGNDHATTSEVIARQFLNEEKYDESRMEKVLHCVRSHRNRDVKPSTLEAKLFAVVDSASHFTWGPYVEMCYQGRSDWAFPKLERDYKDFDAFPELKKELTPLYKAWKKLITELDKIGIN